MELSPSPTKSKSNNLIKIIKGLENELSKRT